MIFIIKDGVTEIGELISAKIELSLDNLCRSFTFIGQPYKRPIPKEEDLVSKSGPYKTYCNIPPFPKNSFERPVDYFKAGDYVEIFTSKSGEVPSAYDIAGSEKFTDIPLFRLVSGYVDSIAIDYYMAEERQTHTMTIKGRSILQDLVDSTINAEYIESVNFETMTRNVLDLLGLKDISIINKVGKLEPFVNEIQSAGIGISAFDFLSSYAEKKQLLLNETSRGDLVIQRASNKKRENVKLVNNLDRQEECNIKSASFELNIDNRFYKYICDSQMNPALQKVELTKEELTNQKSDSLDTLIRPSRQFELNSSEDVAYEDVIQRAIWERNVRRARSFNYSCVVSDHLAQDDEVWRLNELVYVNDKFCELDGYFLVKKLVFEESIEGGKITTIDLTYPNAYSLSLKDEESLERTLNKVDTTFIKDNKKDNGKTQKNIKNRVFSRKIIDD
jgi:prophage tail gpP-like protein